MKIILSRKGWDAGYGKRPSPVFPDSMLQSLPIECSPPSPPYTSISPAALKAQGYADLASFLADYHPALGGRGIAHLDPDLERGAFKRASGWQPCFGQDNSSQAARHLDRQGVSIGDLFLFYGWFDDVLKLGSAWKRTGHDRHTIWGWLQVEQIFDAESFSSSPTWLRYHPHVIHAASYAHNRIYVAGEKLRIGNEPISGFAGGGVFGREVPARCITSVPGHRKLFPTKLPPWLTPTKHRQEQVWDTSGSPLALPWVRSLFV